MVASIDVSEVIVVGAGIAGASTAFFLAKRGINTTLIEKQTPAAGPTGMSSAICHAFYTSTELSKLAARGCELLKSLPELTGEPNNYFYEVGMLWTTGENSADEWREAVERIKGYDVKIEHLQPQDVKQFIPNYKLDDIVYGVWEPEYGYADAYGATNAFVAAGKRHGLSVKNNTRVTGILVKSGIVEGVRTKDGSVYNADQVVVAAGPWARPLISTLGIDLPLTVERHPIAVLDASTEKVKSLPVAYFDELTCTYGRPEGKDTVLLGAWAGGGTGERQNEQDHRDLVDNPDTYKEGMETEETVDILSQVIKRIPSMENLGLRPGYAGLYDMSPDDYPIIGPVGSIDGIWLICGSSGHGFKTGPSVGEEVCKSICGEKSDLLAPFRLSRFQNQAAKVCKGSQQI